MSWRPFFASNKLVKDYEPLRRYLEKTKGTEHYDKAFISEEDFKKLKELAHGKKLGELWDELTELMKKRVDPQLAYEVLRESGYEVQSPEEAQERMARILAGWLIEAGEEWGTIKFRDVTRA